MALSRSRRAYAPTELSGEYDPRFLALGAWDAMGMPNSKLKNYGCKYSYGFVGRFED